MRLSLCHHQLSNKLKRLCTFDLPRSYPLSFVHFEINIYSVIASVSCPKALYHLEKNDSGVFIFIPAHISSFLQQEYNK